MYLADRDFLHSDSEPESQTDHDVNLWAIAGYEKGTAKAYVPQSQCRQAAAATFRLAYPYHSHLSIPVLPPLRLALDKLHAPFVHPPGLLNLYWRCHAVRFDRSKRRP
jgi:hypothetical protein